MAKIKSTDEPVGRMAKLMAGLYYFMAKEMLDRLGEEAGEKAIRSAVTKFGQARLASMKEEAQEKGLKMNSETYGIVRDMPGLSWKRDPQHPTDITYCPMQDMWEMLEKQPLQKIGGLYCEIDDILYQGFNTQFERPLCKTHGDSCCRFIVK